MRLHRIDWRELVVKDLWCEAYERLEADLSARPWYARGSIVPRWLGGLPTQFIREVNELAKWLKVRPRTVAIAQLVYDEAWEVDDLLPSRGCTSVSSSRSFGRNLDYGYPENASDYVYHESLVLDGHAVEVEMFAGLMGWLALSSDRVQVCVNQAPSLRGLRRDRIPGMLWFREFTRRLMADDGDCYSADGENDLGRNSPASDVLMQAHIGDSRYIVETYGRRLAWRRLPPTGLVAQANTYQVFDLRTDSEWESESRGRCQSAVEAGTVRAGLRASAVEGWTIDTFMMR